MKYYLFFLLFILICWFYYFEQNDLYHLLSKNIPVILTMVFGSFIAGGTAEGGGAVAFPVFTLLLNVEPFVAKNFSLAIQSIGMTSASLIILGLKIPIEKKAILYSIIGGIVGLLIGTFYLQKIFSPKLLKLLFVSIWLGFGFALFKINKLDSRKINDSIQLKKDDKLKLIVFGFIGGIITSFFGNGIDILIFCLLTLYFNLSEKVATPTSVIIMSILTIFGFLLHSFVLKNFPEEAFNYWLCCIPVVVFFAPLGAYIVSLLNRKVIAYFLYSVLIIQYLGAVIILKPSLYKLFLSLTVIFVFAFIFYKLNKKSHYYESSN
jgi:uncharacterized membrane protein YfcA